MTRAQHYLSALMENVAEGHIASDDHRLAFAKIKEKLSETADFNGELRTLYRVRGLGDFALALMWLAEQVERDPAKTDYTVDEQGFVVDRFRMGVGDAEGAPLEDFTSPAEAALEPPAVLDPEVASEQPVVEETVEMPQHLQMETAGPIDESEKAVYAPPAGIDESQFGPLMERFVEAMQSGSDDRETLMKSVIDQSSAITAPGSGSSDDLREFCQYTMEFLTYISENGFLDDVRVMNILSNVSGPVSTWAQTAPDARQGLLAEGTEMLRTFKSLFE